MGGRDSLPGRPVPRAAMDTSWESDHLWICLLALGFHSKCLHDIRLGRDMFDRPNGKAFSAIACFLFTKLDKERAEEVFMPSEFENSSSFKFRKHCCLWLREISKQKNSGFPKITPSMLVSPGGARFIHMVYCFARYVMIEEAKKLCVGTGIPFDETEIWTTEDTYMGEARHRVAYHKLLQVLQWEDFVVQEYKKKAQVLIGEIRRTMYEYGVVQKFCRMKQFDQNKNDTTERIQKVRSMWTGVLEMLASLKKEKEVVDSVLEDCVIPCILDGTDVVLSVPKLLTYRVESSIHAFCTGNLYEDGKLNFLTVIQLLNEALMTLRDEGWPCELKELHRIEDVVTSYKNTLQELDRRSLRREQLHCEPKRQSVSRKQEIWASKWKTFLGQCPFNLILEGVQKSASSHKSSSSSDEDEDSVFAQSFSGNYDSRHDECSGRNDGALETMKDTALVLSSDFIQPGGFSASETTDSHLLSPFLRRPSVSLVSAASENSDLLIDLNTCVENKKPVPPKILENEKEEFPTSEMGENAGEIVTQPKSPVKKDDLEKARDNVAEEIAKSVMSESFDYGEEGIALDDLISSLSFNPFITRKQIHQTPENLLTEIRSSWRKAIKTEGSLDLELSSTEVVTEESSMNATPSVQEEMDSTIVCREPASPLSDYGPLVSEKRSQLSPTDSSYQEQVNVRHTFESSESKTSVIQERERTESKELDCSALGGSSVEDLSQTLQNAEKSMNIPDTSLESGSGTNTLPSDHGGSFLKNETLCWNVSALKSLAHKTAGMGILNETLPESDGLDPSTSASSDSYFFTMDFENLTDGSGNNEDNKKMDLDIQSPSNSDEELKKTASKSEEELHQTHNGDKSVRCRAELSVILEEEEEEEDDASFTDEVFTKMTSPNSPSESKCYLSPLLVSCQQMDGTGSPINLLHKLKGKNC